MPAKPARRFTATSTKQYRADCRDCRYVGEWQTVDTAADRDAVAHQRDTDYTHEVDVYVVDIRTRIRAAKG